VIANRDRAAVVATAVVQIVEASSATQSVRLQVAAYLRDEFADIERRVLADRIARE
jgi:hypothetical protein